MRRAIVLCSGGLDSIVCAHYVRKKLKVRDVKIVFFDYGQRARIEEEKSARRCAKDIGGEFIKIEITKMNIVDSELVKHGKIKISKKSLKNTSLESKRWYFPQRNLIFLSYALAIAESYAGKSEKCDIFLGFKNEGVEHYPDTTPEFVEAVNKLVRASKISNIIVKAPLIKMDKEDIVQLGLNMGVKLEKTYSCYIGGKKQCGECLACRLRRAGFHWANTKDKTEYAK